MMILLFKSLFLLATLALLTAQVSAHSLHSLVKRKVTGDKLYVLFNRSSCVTVQSDVACPVSWKLPSEYALNYKTDAEGLRLLEKVLDQFNYGFGVGTSCKNSLAKAVCSQMAPKCLPDGGKDFGDARTQCQDIYSTCPTILANAYKSQRYCEENFTGKHKKAACVAPDGHIVGACPQPKYKMPADLLKLYKRASPTKVKSFKTFENLKDLNGNLLLSTRCLNLIKDFGCRAVYCSQDEEKLLVDHDYKDCEEARECYRRAFSADPETKQLLEPLYQSLEHVCLALPKRATAKLEAASELLGEPNAKITSKPSTSNSQPSPTNSVGNTNNGEFSKILFLFTAVYVGYIV